MEVKVSFDRDKLEEWFNEDCEIECENCPLDEYICDTLSFALHEARAQKKWNDNNNK